MISRAPENAATVETAVALLRIAAIFQIFDASQATLANMLRGLHDSRLPLVIALLGYWAIGAPIGIALGFAASLGAVGVWIGLACGLAAVAILLMIRWLAKAAAGLPLTMRNYGARTNGEWRPRGHNRNWPACWLSLIFPNFSASPCLSQKSRRRS